ncbi:Condensin complex subunit 2 Chromosome-associated protein [Vigna angularis]|uniref:Condensin complex subunit 2 Chromosome-associated protein n=1 Tax=Phaseolus angularis TaxID=3914 RepID=A0A8T0JH21_PHAAN|nr:Condensin complex subunit 2 Chromosome-associated protein [Vigna angularis]
MAHKKRVPMSARMQSPTSAFFMGSNDDQLERAQARAARAAAIRHNSIAVNFHSHPPKSPSCLNKHQILELFHNCIKLASENKINQKNTWELDLIDHLTDIIRVEEGNHVETNFQIASCTLEAGVRIYSLRVDSVHSDAYKVLAGMNRAGQDNQEGATLGSVNTENGEASRKEVEKKLSHLSTLESSFEVLNIKKFDGDLKSLSVCHLFVMWDRDCADNVFVCSVAFAVDPLYHHTSAKFDEGGAKSLLMNNLGVYGKCRVLFDSLEVPPKCITSQNDHDISDTIDLSFARDCVEQMILNMHTKDAISPTLRIIVNQSDENNGRPFAFQSSGEKSAEEFDAAIDCELAIGKKGYENCSSWSYDHDSQTFAAEWGFSDAYPSFPSYHEEKEPNMDDIFDNVDGYLFLSLGFRSKKNSWAGPDHWKYQKVQDDWHYEPEDLINLFLLPHVKCIRRRARKVPDVLEEQCYNNEPFPSWDNGSVCDGDVTDVNNDTEDSSTLISLPRQINKIEVQYDKISKQVNVQALKITLWDHIQECIQLPFQGHREKVSFRHILTNFPSKCNAAATISDISPHLCFICLLHLANEKGLSIQSCPNLDDLSICLLDDGATTTRTI